MYNSMVICFLVRDHLRLKGVKQSPFSHSQDSKLAWRGLGVGGCSDSSLPGVRGATSPGWEIHIPGVSVLTSTIHPALTWASPCLRAKLLQAWQLGSKKKCLGRGLSMRARQKLRGFLQPSLRSPTVSPLPLLLVRAVTAHPQRWT